MIGTLGCSRAIDRLTWPCRRTPIAGDGGDDSVRGDLAHAEVAGIGDEQVACAVDRHTCREVQKCCADCRASVAQRKTVGRAGTALCAGSRDRRDGSGRGNLANTMGARFPRCTSYRRYPPPVRSESLFPVDGQLQLRADGGPAVAGHSRRQAGMEATARMIPSGVTLRIVRPALSAIKRLPAAFTVTAVGPLNCARVARPAVARWSAVSFRCRPRRSGRRPARSSRQPVRPQRTGYPRRRRSYPRSSKARSAARWRSDRPAKLSGGCIRRSQ